ncbi:MAG: PhzF family phenazine biosynthesis protein [Terracidiphilus sp.]
MPNLDYRIADDFAVTPLAGNPLAVVMGTCALTTERMQAIAREFNLSETRFVKRSAIGVEWAEGVHIGARVWRSDGPAIFSCRREGNPRGSGICASRVAQFLWQKDSFSCRVAHAFNRNSSSQLTEYSGSSDFSFVTRGFSAKSSLNDPSFQEPPVRIRFRFVADNSRARLLGSCLTRQNAEHLTAKQG